MKNLLLLAVTVVWMMACNETDASKTSNPETNQKTDSASLTSIEWVEQDKNLGKITEGQQLEVNFRFKNTGDKPLIIRSVRPGCGCTVADPPKEPVAPGAEGVIKGSFDSQGRTGLNHKEIYVDANTEGSPNHVLKFQVEVVKQNK